MPFPASDNLRINLYFLVPNLIVTFALQYIMSIVYGSGIFQKSGCMFFCKDRDPLTDVVDSLLMTVTMDIAGPVSLLGCPVVYRLY